MTIGNLRAFAPPGSRPSVADVVPLEREELHYLTRVRRVTGAEFELLDDAGEIWRARLSSDGNGAEILARVERPGPSREVALLLGVPDRPAAIECIRLACVLGAASIHWVRCARSQGGPPSTSRVEKVLRAARRQCGRGSTPVVHAPRPLRDVVESGTGVPLWVATPGSPASPPAPEGPLRLLIGPEGGLDPDETSAAAEAGTPIGLGPYVLTTPVAVAAGLTLGLRP